MQRDSKKYEDILEYESKAIEDIKSNFEGKEKQTRLFVKSIMIGALLGIFGIIFFFSLLNIIVAVSVGIHLETFVDSLVVCSISLTVIVFMTAYIYYQIRRANEKITLFRESMDVIEYAIKRRQHILEQKRDRLESK